MIQMIQTNEFNWILQMAAADNMQSFHWRWLNKRVESPVSHVLLKRGWGRQRGRGNWQGGWNILWFFCSSGSAGHEKHSGSRWCIDNRLVYRTVYWNSFWVIKVNVLSYSSSCITFIWFLIIWSYQPVGMRMSGSRKRSDRFHRRKRREHFEAGK